MRNARIEVVSYWPVERLATAEAVSWLDQAIVTDKKPIIHEKGFGADVAKALIAREEWLIANRHASVEQPGTLTPKPDILRELNIEASPPPLKKCPPSWECRITPVIKCRQEFTLVPWRPELLKMHGKEINVSVRARRITMALARGRVRDLGLSR